MKRLLAALVAGLVVLAVAASTQQTDARWSASRDLGLAPVTLRIEVPEPQNPASFDVRAAMSGNRTVVPGLGADPADNVVPADVVYTASVLNLGPDDATDLTLAIDVPLVQNLDLVAVTPPTGVVCDTSQASVPQHGGQHGLVTCTVPGPVAADDAVAVTVAMRASQALAVAEFTASVTVSSPREAAGAQGNNTASWLLSSPNKLIDLSLHKAGPASVIAGKNAVYTLTVKNEPVGAETSQADPPTVVDTLPAGVTFLPSTVTGSPSPPWCVADGQTVTCQVPQTIASGASVTIPLGVQFDASLGGTTVTNTATVHNAPTNVDPDPSLANNTWTATTAVAEDHGAQSCPSGWYFDIFTMSCVDPSAPVGGGDGPGGGLPPSPANPLCTDGSMNYDIPPMELAQSIPQTYLNPSTGALSTTSGTGLVAGRWSQYVTPGAIFLDDDVSYQVKVAAPQLWVDRARTAPFSALQVSVPGGSIPSATGNVWTGAPMTVTPALLDHPFNVSVSVDRSTGQASNATIMLPAVVLLMIDITDASGSTRTVQGYFVTKPLHQGSTVAITCTSNLVGGVSLWGWTQAQLEAIGFARGAQATEAAAAAVLALSDGLALEGQPLLAEQDQVPPDETVGKKDEPDAGETEGLVDSDPQVQEPPGPEVLEASPPAS